VEVHHRLAGDLADVHADVVAVGVEPVVEEVFCLPDEREEGDLFGVASKRPAMSNDAGDREVVEPSNCAMPAAVQEARERLKEELTQSIMRTE